MIRFLKLIFFDGHYPVTSDNEDEDELIGSSRFIEDDIIPLEKIVSIND